MYQSASAIQQVEVNLYEELYKNLPEKTVGDRIKKSRLIKNLSQYQLGRLIDVSHSTIQDYESGVCFPSPNIIAKISKNLNKPIQYYYDDYYKFIFSNYSHIIKNWRIKNNLSYWHAGKLTGIDYRTFKNWENSITIIDRVYYEKLKPYLLIQNSSSI